MAGQQNLVLPFIVNPIEITRNIEAVFNGFLAIQRFSRANIWSPLRPIFILFLLVELQGLFGICRMLKL
jgi:hypothetical protein